MPIGQKRAWVMMVASALAYAVYVVLLLIRRDGGPIAETAYIAPLLWTVGGSVAGLTVTV